MRNVKEAIVEKIRSGEVSMRPRWYFVLEATLRTVGAILSLLIAIYLASLILFALRETGVWFAPGLGWRGLQFFLVSSPWIIVTLLVAFLGVLYMLVTRYSFSYRRPLLYSLLLIVSLVVCLATVVHQTTFHARIQSYLETHRLPGMSSFYMRHSMQRPAGVTYGEVVRFDEPDFFISAEASQIFRVRVTSQTVFVTAEPLSQGSLVFVFGERDNDTITAFGVRQVPPGYGESPRRLHLRSAESGQ